MVHQGLDDAATLVLFFFFLFIYLSLFILLLLTSRPPPPALLVCTCKPPPSRPPSATAPVSCQVSSLLALSVSQRTDKSEPGVGLSLPLATEVSFSPSIIHILFNLTRWKWPRSVRTSHPAKQTRAGFSQRWGGSLSITGLTLRIMMNGTTSDACSELMTLGGGLPSAL